MIGRILQVSADLVLVSAFAAGAQRVAGVEFKAQKIENDLARSAITSYLWVGQWTLDTAASQLKKYPEYFSKNGK
eukprot:jgi/Hompol1/1242/HPOL_003110-RA